MAMKMLDINLIRRKRNIGSSMTNGSKTNLKGTATASASPNRAANVSPMDSLNDGTLDENARREMQAKLNAQVANFMS